MHLLLSLAYTITNRKTGGNKMLIVSQDRDLIHAYKKGMGLDHVAVYFIGNLMGYNVILNNLSIGTFNDEKECRAEVRAIKNCSKEIYVINNFSEDGEG